MNIQYQKTKLLGQQFRCGGGGGGGGSPNQTVTKELPDYAKPFAKEVLGVGSSLGFTRGADGQITGLQPYQQYQGERNAQFTPLQQRSFEGAANMGPTQGNTDAQGIAGIAAQRALDMGYEPGKFQNQFNAPGQYETGQFGPQNVQAPQLNQYSMGPADQVQGQGYNAATMGAAQTGFNPQLQTFQMGPAERVTSESFNRPGTAQDFMSPYMQNVVDIQQREAQRTADIAGTQRGASAAKSGAFGGSRQAIMDAEAARNLATQKGDIQATGQQAAFQNAQQQFNAEQQRQMAAQQANQGAGLTVGQQNLGSQISTQQLGTQTGLQTSLANLSSQQQANVQNQAAQNQAMGMSAQQAMQAALANQGAGLTVGQQNLGSQMGTQQLGTQTGLQTSLANLSSQQQANVQNQAAQNQAMGMSAQQAMQAALANQGAGLTVGQQNLSAQLGIQQLGAGQDMQAQLANQQSGMDAQRLREQSRQFGAGQGMTAAQLQAQYGQSAQQLEEQSRQYGAGIGMQGIQNALAGAGQMGNLGNQEFNMRMDANRRQSELGGQQQGQIQRKLDQDYENFLKEKRNPYDQVEFMSNLLRETPTGSTTSMYQAPPSMGSQLLGAGTALGGAYLAGRPRAKGGIVYAAGGRVRKAAGLNELALKKMRG